MDATCPLPRTGAWTMRLLTHIFTAASSGLLFVTLASGALITLNAYNTEPLVEDDGFTSLLGDMSNGDLAQLIFTGPDGLIDDPSIFTGLPAGDDVLFSDPLNPFHVGVGQPVSGTGVFDLFGLQYDDTLAGSLVYVRFWDASTILGADFFGNTQVLALPPGDAFDQAELDFVTVLADPRTADTPFAISLAVNRVPEPSQVVYIMIGCAALWFRSRKILWLSEDDNQAR